MPFQQSHLPFQHRDIPVLPLRPRVHPISNHLSRSYCAGRQNFSRACQGKPIGLTLTAQDAFAETVQARLVTTLNSAEGTAQAPIPFTRTDPRTLTCRIMPERLGLHSYRAEFSLDGGDTWLRDTIPDAWVLVDPSQVDGLRLYTLIPGASGTIADWKTDLKRIQTMGFNAVHLLPVTAQDASGSPYAAAELFSVDPRYLSTASQMDGLSQLEEYVVEAKLLEMRLCFDLVLNHVGAGSAMARRAPDWIVPDQNQPDGFGRARYWSENAWHTWDDLVLINYEHPSESIRSEIWAYMTDYALFWSAYADYTGGFVRFDNLHSSNPDFIETLTTTLHSKYPQVGFLAEYFTDDHTLLRTAPAWGLNLLLATPWNYKFVPQLREYLKYLHRVSGQVRYFMPITSQDSGSPAQEFGTADSTIPRYVAAALLGTGATGMPQGVEFGESERIDFVGRRGRDAASCRTTVRVFHQPCQRHSRGPFRLPVRGKLPLFG